MNPSSQCRWIAIALRLIPNRNMKRQQRQEIFHPSTAWKRHNIHNCQQLRHLGKQPHFCRIRSQMEADGKYARYGALFVKIFHPHFHGGAFMVCRLWPSRSYSRLIHSAFHFRFSSLSTSTSNRKITRQSVGTSSTPFIMRRKGVVPTQ